jgi:hypothetical protein
MAKPFGRSSHAAVDVLCPAFNLNTIAACDGSQLLRTANPSQSVIQCQYLDGDLCSYSRGVCITVRCETQSLIPY